jgi:hypothetical protein
MAWCLPGLADVCAFDAAIFLALEWQLEILGYCWITGVDANGRVSRLRVWCTEGASADLNGMIVGCFEGLVELDVEIAETIPRNLRCNDEHARWSQTFTDRCHPRLHPLSTVYAPAAGALNLARMGLSVKNFTAMAKGMCWIDAHLPSLKNLSLFYVQPRSDDVSSPSDATAALLWLKQDRSKVLRSSLSTLYWYYANGDQLTELLLSILPKYPNIIDLSLYCDDSELDSRFFKTLSHGFALMKLNATNSKNGLDHSPALRSLDFSETYLEHEECGQDADAFFSSILDFFPQLSSICLYGYNMSDETQYLLRINHCGRVLVEGSKSQARALPLSMWPTVLERAHKNYPREVGRDPTPTGLFYLLRNGPVLPMCGRDEYDSGSGSSLTSPNVDVPVRPSCGGATVTTSMGVKRKLEDVAVLENKKLD